MIKGSEKFIETLQGELTEIEADILSLEKNIAELEKDIDHENEFKIEVIKKNRAIQSDINMLKTALSKAKNKREQIIKDNAKKSYKAVNDFLTAYKVAAKNTTNDKVLKIITKVEEIRALDEEIKAVDKEVQAEILAFVEQVKGFLDPEPRNELVLWGQSQTQYDYLKHLHQLSQTKIATFVNHVESETLGVKGIYKPESYGNTQEKLDKLKVSLQGK